MLVLVDMPDTDDWPEAADDTDSIDSLLLLLGSEGLRGGNAGTCSVEDREGR